MESREGISRMWYIGMDVGGTNIDCVAVDENGANPEDHQVRPVSVTPHTGALYVHQR